MVAPVVATSIGGTRGSNKYMVSPVVATVIWWHPWCQQVLVAPVVVTSIGGTRGGDKYWRNPYHNGTRERSSYGNHQALCRFLAAMCFSNCWKKCFSIFPQLV